MRLFKTRLLVCAAASLMLVGCWNEEEDSAAEEKVNITSVKVFGDSLADVGTFGAKFTVQNAPPAAAPLIYADRVALAYGITSLCPVYVSSDGGATITKNTTAGCTGHAIGGGRINNPSNPSSQISIRTQLSAATAASTYTANDLLVIDGGGNDAADLVGAYLTAAGDSAAAYLALVGSLLDAGTISTVMAGANGLENLGGLYMQALANAFYDSIKTSALDKGAQHVVLINLPGITKTPRFQAALDSVATAYGGGATGAAARASAEGLFQTWIQAFNSTLASKVSGNSKVMLVDSYTLLEDMVANPTKSAYGLTNATTPACTATTAGGDTDWTKCVDALLAANIPVGATGGSSWWTTYLFSDGFHPTPRGHELFYNAIRTQLVASGRL
jgi:phospholipase/lecithinase/hemolysin